MTRFQHMLRFLAIFLVSVWGALGVVAQAHAAEEDIHHAMQHDGAEEAVSSSDQPVDEGAVHPEHAAHCHSGACHFHVMARGASGPVATAITVMRLTLPQNDVVQQTDLSSLFHPPRI